MVLNKEQYYKRRWFLTILFLISGLWLIYVSYGIFSYNKNKEELHLNSNIPELLEIKNNDKDYKSLYLKFDDNSVSSVIKDAEINKITSILKENNINHGNSLKLNKNELKNFDFRFLYWKDKLYELKINDEIIIPFKKGNNKIAYIVLGIGIIWTGFQLWALFTLITKGRKVYDESFKDKSKISKN